MEGRAGVQRKLTAILSADVVGYSRLMTDDDVGTVRRLTEYRALMKTCVEGYRGRVVDAPGDAMLAEFPSVVDAVECAVVIQKELKALNDRLPAGRQMQYRIGINLGDVIVDGDKIYGDGVNIAARLESLADPGGICISASAYDQIENKLPLGYQSLGPQTVKNFSKPVQVYRAITSVEESPVVAAPAAPVVTTADVRTEPVAEVAFAGGNASASRRRAALVAGIFVALGAVGGIAIWRLTGPSSTTAAVTAPAAPAAPAGPAAAPWTPVPTPTPAPAPAAATSTPPTSTSTPPAKAPAKERATSSSQRTVTKPAPPKPPEASAEASAPKPRASAEARPSNGTGSTTPAPESPRRDAPKPAPTVAPVREQPVQGP